MKVRRLDASEMALATPLLAPEGWALEPPELARLHALGGAVGAFDGDHLVGFLTFVDTPPYRWIGNVAVAASGRGRGVGAKLVDEAMRGAERIALYSVEKAVSLYERAGLVAHGALHAMRADAARPEAGGSRPYTAADLADAQALDRAATGMDRSRLLAALVAAHPARVVRKEGKLVAFGIAKAYADVTEIGPVVADSPADAWAVIDDLMRETRAPHDIALHMPDASATARGFAPTFRPIPMFRGGAPSWDLSRYVAAAGLEKG